MKYAIVALGGKQIKIKEGQTFSIERQEKLNMEVLAYSAGKEFLVGSPTLADIIVKASIVGEERAPKITVARYKSKSRYRRKKGHRQPMSVVTIESILKKGEKAEKKETKSAKVEDKENKSSAKTEKKSETKEKTTAKAKTAKKTTKSKKVTEKDSK